MYAEYDPSNNSVNMYMKKLIGGGTQQTFSKFCHNTSVMQTF
jgi:hypothetical protein